jgi:hypothetical protein
MATINEQSKTATVKVHFRYGTEILTDIIEDATLTEYGDSYIFIDTKTGMFAYPRECVVKVEETVNEGEPSDFLRDILA